MIKKFWLYGLFGVVVLFTVSYFGYNQFFAAKNIEVKEIEHKVAKGEIQKVIDASGIVKPSVGAEITVGARVTGLVVQQNVKVGDIVKKGDLIAVIDDRTKKEGLQASEAELKDIKMSYPKKVAIEEKKLENAKNSMELASWQFENKRKLYEGAKKYITEEEYKKAKNDAENSKTSYESQLLTLENLKSEYKTKLVTSQSAYKQNAIELEYSKIFAPITGVISFVSTQQGETVVAGMNAPQFVKILDPKELENRIYVDETEIGKVKVGMDAVFTVDTYRNKKFMGKVVQIYPTPTVQNNVVYFTVVVDNFEGVTLLRPEMTTHNKIILETQKDVLLVPNGAVKFKDGKYIVYKKINTKTEEREVKIGTSDDKNTVIIDGLKEGDTVMEKIANGKKNLPDNAKRKLKY